MRLLKVERSEGGKQSKDSRQALPGLLGLVDVTFVQGAAVASRLTQCLMELELDDEANEVPGGGEVWQGLGGEGPVTPSSCFLLQPGCQGEPTLALRPPFHTSPPRGSLHMSGGPLPTSSGGHS